MIPQPRSQQIVYIPCFIHLQPHQLSGLCNLCTLKMLMKGKNWVFLPYVV